MNKLKYYFYLLVCFSTLMSSCSLSRYVKDGQFFLSENKIKLESSAKLANQEQLLLELSALLKQKPNGKVLFLNRRWLHYYSRGLIKRNFGEVPVFLDTEAAKDASSSMVKLLHKRGYLDAQVQNEFVKKRTHWFSGDRKNPKSAVSVYRVFTNRPYLVDSLFYTSEDTGVLKLLKMSQNSSFFKKNELLDSRKYDQETARISSLLKNNGYATFAPNFISPTLDSNNHRVNVVLDIQLSPDAKPHQLYTIGEVLIRPTSKIKSLDAVETDTIIQNFRFITQSDKNKISADAVTRFFLFKKGDLYNQYAIDKSFQKINSSGLYKFVNVRSKIDTADNSRINFEVTLTPEKKMTAQAELDVHFSNNIAPQTISSRYLFGPSLNLLFKNRNFLGAGETFSISTDFGFDLDQTFRNVNLLNFKLQPTLSFAKYIDLYGLKYLFSSKDNKWYNILKNNGVSQISSTLSYQKFFKAYQNWLATASWGFQLKSETPNGSHNWKVNHFGVDYLNPTTSTAFDSIIANNPLLKNGFVPQLFTGFLIRDISHSWIKSTNISGESWQILTNFELSGLELLVADKILNKKIRFLDVFEFAKFLRLESDVRYQRQFSGNNVLATRLRAGIVLPFSKSQNIPYIKQFFLGGPNSIRGWRVRELGPGAFRDTAANKNLFYYQSGDIVLEGNIEHRFPIWWRVKGATFLDIGNVWNLRPDPARPESKLPNIKQLWNQLAIGTGFGLRVDASFAVIRVDLGYKLKNPFADENGRRWIIQKPSDLKFSQINWNFGINYPF